MAFIPPRLWALNHIIAPHGITDVVHAQVYKQYPVLTVFYGGSTLTGWLLHSTQHDVFLYSIFGVLSIVHFRNDFVLPKWVLSSSTLLLMLQGSSLDALFFYMMVIHVPNHFRTAWSYVKKMPLLTLVLLSATGVWCDYYLLSELWNHPYLMISVMMGHILYQEFCHRFYDPSLTD